MARRRFISNNTGSTSGSGMGSLFVKFLISAAVCLISGYIIREFTGTESESSLIPGLVFMVSGIICFIYFIRWFVKFID